MASIFSILFYLFDISHTAEKKDHYLAFL